MRSNSTFDVVFWAPDWDRAKTESRASAIDAMSILVTHAWYAGLPVDEISAHLVRRWGDLGEIGLTVETRGEGHWVRSRALLSVETESSVAVP